MVKSSLTVLFATLLLASCSTPRFPPNISHAETVRAKSFLKTVKLQPPAVKARPAVPEPFTLGPEDVVSVTVYNNEDLSTTQAVRPDGFISVLSAGEIKANGRTVTDVRHEIEQRLSTIIKDPQVNVVITQYNSRKVWILGAVASPGVVKLQSATSLVEAISSVGGLSADADLSRSIMFRRQDVVPVNFQKLFKGGDISQNIQVQKNDTIFIASSRDNKVYVLGEVANAGSYFSEGGLTLLEAIPLAGGYKRDAETGEVIVIKGGLAEPTLTLVDAESVFTEGKFQNNVPLESGDIVFVPKTRLASMERYFEFATRALQPILSLGSAVILWESAIGVLGGGTSGGVDVSIPIGP